MGFFDTIKDIGSSIVKGVTSIPGALIGGAIDLGSSWLGNELIGKPNADDAYAQSQQATAQAFERSYGAYKRRYQDTMADMREAGLNPILAAGSGGFQVSGQPEMSSAQSFMPNYPQLASSSAYQSMQAGRLNDQKAQTEQVERVKKGQEALNIAQDRFKKFEETILLRSTNKKVVAEIYNVKQELWNKIAAFKETITKSYLNLSQTEVNQETVQVLKGQYQNIQKTIEKAEIALKKLRQHGKFYEGAGGFWLQAVHEALQLINPFTVLKPQ